MYLEELLGYGTINTFIKIQDIDTKEVLYQGANGYYHQEEDYKVAYFRIDTIEDKNYMFIGVYIK